MSSCDGIRANSAAEADAGGVIGSEPDGCALVGGLIIVAWRTRAFLPMPDLGVRPLRTAVDVERGNGGGAPAGKAGVANPAETRGVNA